MGLDFHDNLLARLHDMRLERLKQHKPVVDLSMINPDLTPPRFLLDKLIESSLRPYNHRYAVSRGVRKLRVAFAHKYRRAFGIDLDPEHQVCATFGTKDAVLQTLAACTDPGDSVLCVEPTYPAYMSSIRYARLSASFVQAGPSLEELVTEIASKVARLQPKVILINFPSNPTGRCVDESFYEELASALDGFSGVLLNDLAYGEMRFDRELGPSALSAKGLRVVETYTMSKAYSVPGWRVGALLGDAEVVSRVARIKSHIDYGLHLPVQLAAAAGLECTESLVETAVEAYQRRIVVLVEGLSQAGWELSAPQAGVCVWAKLPDRVDGTAFDYCRRMLDRHGVVALPGDLFGKDFARFVRFAAVVSQESMYEVLEGITND